MRNFYEHYKHIENKKLALSLLFLFLLFATIAIPTLCKMLIGEDNSIVYWDGTVASSYHAGNGTINNPYIIETPSEFAYLSKMVNEGTDYTNVYFKLNNNLYLNAGVFDSTEDEDFYIIGDVLLCKEVNPSELQVGDDISYLGKESSFKGKVVTHRIIKKEKNNKGEWIFYTQGLANNIPDPTITSNQIYGKVVRNMSLLSKVHKLISTPGGFYLCIFIPLLILIGSEIISSMVERFEHKRLKD